MAFVIDQITNVRAQDKANRVQGLWMYRTEDSRSTVTAADYFLNGKVLIPDTTTTLTTSSTTQLFIGSFYEGDKILIQQVASGTNQVVDSYEVIVSVIIKGSAPLIVVSASSGDEIVAFGTLTDISTSSTVTITFGQEVEVTKIDTYLGGTIATADSDITFAIGGTDLDGSPLTVAYSGSALGDKDSSSPYGNRTGTAIVATTDGASTVLQPLYIVMRGRVVEGLVEKFTLKITDVSTADAEAFVSPVSGTIVKIESCLEGAITSVDAVVTCDILTTAITAGVLTISYTGSAAGTIDTVFPTAANTLAEGDYVTATTNGGSTGTQALYVTFHVLR